MNKKKILVTIITTFAFLVIWLQPVADSAVEINVSPSRPILVELFTSEGCSSCPPADKVLHDLADEKYQDIILPLSFHVDYWNHLGWKDEFSDEKYTLRQRFYRGIFKKNGIYTPQMVVDGKYETVGSRKYSIYNAINKFALEVEQQNLTTNIDDGKITVHIPANQNITSEIMVIIVGYNISETSDITKGENRGDKLTHSNVVQYYEHLGVWTGQQSILNSNKPDTNHAVIILQDTQTAHIKGIKKIF